MEELIKIFDIKKVQKKGGIFNIEKLDWLNREYILHTSNEKQIQNLKEQITNTKYKDNKKWQDDEFTEKFIKIILDRIHRWGEVREVIEAGEFDYLFEKPVLDKEKICWKNQSLEKAKENLEKVLRILNEGNYNIVKNKIMELAEKEGKGEVLWPLRYALSGREKSPDPFTLIDILGIRESEDRLDKAVEVLNIN